MLFEHSSQPVLPRRQWMGRVARSVALAGSITGMTWGVGVLGYHVLGRLGWVDAILEASMILGGMGAIAPMANDGVKLFASTYAMFSGLVLVTTTGVLLAPWLHRIMHHLHVDAAVRPKRPTVH